MIVRRVVDRNDRHQSTRFKQFGSRQPSRSAFSSQHEFGFSNAGAE
jgi:hypothetical protein